MSIYRQVNQFREDVERAAIERDAARYRWLKKKLQFVLQAYNGPDEIDNATWSLWSMKTGGEFAGTSEPPQTIDAAIDAAMKEG